MCVYLCLFVPSALWFALDELSGYFFNVTVYWKATYFFNLHHNGDSLLVALKWSFPYSSPRLFLLRIKKVNRKRTFSNLF